MQLSRRTFLGGLFAAPAIVAADRLMPVKLIRLEPAPVWVPAQGQPLASLDLTAVERRILAHLFTDGRLPDMRPRYLPGSKNFSPRIVESIVKVRDLQIDKLYDGLYPPGTVVSRVVFTQHGG